MSSSSHWDRWRFPSTSALRVPVLCREGLSEFLQKHNTEAINSFILYYRRANQDSEMINFLKVPWSEND